MKRHEFEQESLQMILDKCPDDFLQEFNESDLREFMADFLVAWAEFRNNPQLLDSAMSRYVAKMIEYAATYSKKVNDTPTAEDIWNYHQDMKADQWENRHDV